MRADRVGAAFFETIGIPILRGRGFTVADHTDESRVVVVNETMARIARFVKPILAMTPPDLAKRPPDLARLLEEVAREPANRRRRARIAAALLEGVCVWSYLNPPNQ